MSFFDLQVDEERSFLSVVRHTVLEGPLELMRFSDSKKGHAGRLGRYWMYGSEIAEALKQNQGKRLLREISRRWAISDDWGDLELTWLMRIPAHKTIHAYWGFAKFQPKISQKGQEELRKHTRKSYEGGSIQLVVNINEEQEKWIHGPYKTMGLHQSNVMR